MINLSNIFYYYFERLKEKIDFWVKNDQEREKISNKGMIYTQNHHTLAHRAYQLIEILNNN